MTPAIRIRLVAPGALPPGEVFGRLVYGLHRSASRRPFAIDLPEMVAGERPRLGTLLHVFGCPEAEIEALLVPHLSRVCMMDVLDVAALSGWARLERVQFPKGGLPHQRRLLSRLRARREAGLPTSVLERQLSALIPGASSQPFLPMQSTSGTGSFRLYLRRFVKAGSDPSEGSIGPAGSYGLGRWIPAALS